LFGARGEFATAAVYAGIIKSMISGVYINLDQAIERRSAIEQQLALSMAGMQWRLNRCHEIEQSILDFEPGPAQIDSLNKFSLYEHRLSRSFHATLKQFLEIKSARRQQEEKDLQASASILGHLRSKKIAYDPAEDGFVFSLAEVDQWMRRRDNVDDADKARKNINGQAGRVRSARPARAWWPRPRWRPERP